MSYSLRQSQSLETFSFWADTWLLSIVPFKPFKTSFKTLKKYSFLWHILEENQSQTEGGWDLAGKHIFGEEKLRSEIKKKLKSGLKNKYFAKRLSSTSTRNSIGDPISLLLALLTIFFLTFMTTSTYMLAGKKSRILGQRENSCNISPGAQWDASLA